MKNLIIFITILLHGLSFGQNCEDLSLYFYSQSEVDKFPLVYPGCTKVANLHISGDVNNVRGLSQLTDITSTLGISSWHYTSSGELTHPLRDIDGLNNIQYVGEFISIVDVPNLFPTNILSGIFVAPTISIAGKLPLIFSGFNQLTTNSSLSIVDVSSTILTGFNSLTTAGIIEISNSTSLISLTDFLKNLKTIDILLIHNNPNLTDINFSSLATINMGLAVENTALTNLTGFKKLVSMGNSQMGSRPLSTNLSNHSKSVNLNDGYIYITNNVFLESLAGLENLNASTMWPTLNITGNSNLSDCSINSLCNLIDINGTSSVTIEGNAANCNTAAEVFNACSALAVEEYSKDIFLIYPNPVKDYLNIMNYENINEVIIRDLLGRNSIKYNMTNEMLDVRSLSPGVYLLSFSSHKGINNLKFIKD